MTCALTSIIVPVTARGCSPASGKPGLLADASAAGAWLLDAGSADSPGPGGAPLAALPGRRARCLQASHRVLGESGGGLEAGGVIGVFRAVEVRVVVDEVFDLFLPFAAQIGGFVVLALPIERLDEVGDGDLVVGACVIGRPLDEV